MFDKPPVKPIPDARVELKRFFLDKLQSTAVETMMRVSVPIADSHLYRLLIPEENYETMVLASYQMPLLGRWSFQSNQNFMVQFSPNYSQSIEFSFNYFDDETKHINWLWPDKINPITYDSKLGQELLPIIDMAIQWQTTKRLLDLFITHTTPGVTMHMLPWLRQFILDTRSGYSTSYATETDRYLRASKPRYIPGISGWFNSVRQYGTELLSTARMFDRKEKFTTPEGHLILLPILNNFLVEDGVETQFSDFILKLTHSVKKAVDE